MKRIYKNNDLVFNLTVNNYPINKDLIDSIEFKFYSTNPNNCIIKTQDDIDIHNQIILQWNELQYLEKGVMYYDCTVRLTDSTMNDGKLDTVTKIMTNYYICSGIDELDSEYSNYYTKEEVNQLLDSVTSGEVNLTNYYTKSETNTMLQDYVEEDVLGSYYTKNEVNDLIDRIDIPTTDLTNYYNKSETYSKTEVNELIDGVSTGDGEVNLTNYYTKDEVNNLIPKDYLTEIPSEFITETELNKSLSGYAKLTDIPTDYIKEIPSEYITETELNDKGYLISIPSEYAKQTDLPKVPTSNTAFTNDAGYITLSEVPKTDLSDYYKKSEIYTKSEVNELIDGVSTGDVDLTNYYTKEQTYSKSEIENLIPTDYIKEIPSEYITETELNTSLNGYSTTSHTHSEYITEQYDDTALVGRVAALESELTGVSQEINELNGMIV